MDLRGKLLEMLQAQESGQSKRNVSSHSDSRSPSRSSSSSPAVRRSRRKSRRGRSRSREYRRNSRERSRRDKRRGYSRSRSRGRTRGKGYDSRERGKRGYGKRNFRHRPRLGDDFKNKRAPDGRPYCIDFKLGRCNRSDCRYSHKEKELCLDFQRGKCSYGDRCKFAHPKGPSKSSRKDSDDEAKARRRAERRGVKYEPTKKKSSSPPSPKEDEKSDPLPSLVETTEVDVTKSEPVESIHEEGEFPKEEDIEDKEDDILSVEEGEKEFDSKPADCDEPDEPITAKLMEESENVEMEVEARG